MKDEKLYAACQNALPSYIKLWERLVNIDTGTEYGKGINEVGNIVAGILQEIGADVERIPIDGGTKGTHIIGHFHGKGKGRILTMAHMDTVFPVGTAAKRPFKIDGDWAHGPGVSDCKGSIVLFLKAMEQLNNIKFDDFAEITCLFNCDEEMASFNSRTIIQKLAKENDVVLCMESGQVGDGVVMWRKGSSQLKLEAFGKTAHAGSNPETGRNALMELIYHVEKMSKLGNAAKMTTINFTKIQAGDKINVIPDYAVAYADMRHLYPEELERLEKAINELAKVQVIADTTIKVSIKRNNPPFPQNAGTDKLIKCAQNIYGELDKQLCKVGAGGSSDANWAAATGAVAIDGLGPVKGGKNHTERECSKVSSVVPRMYLLARMLMECGKGKENIF